MSVCSNVFFRNTLGEWYDNSPVVRHEAGRKTQGKTLPFLMPRLSDAGLELLLHGNGKRPTCVCFWMEAENPKPPEPKPPGKPAGWTIGRTSITDNAEATRHRKGEAPLKSLAGLPNCTSSWTRIFEKICCDCLERLR